MQLLQSLIKSGLTEAPQVSSNPDAVRMFQHFWNRIDLDLEHLGNALENRSHFTELASKLGAEESEIERAKKAFSELSDALLDLHMSVGIAQEQGDRWNK